jgi:hypothetical protein
MRSKKDDNFGIEIILGGLIVSCMFAGYRLFRVVSLADDVRTYIALRDNPGTGGDALTVAPTPLPATNQDL